MTLPVNHQVLASGACSWEPESSIEYTTISVLHDAEAKSIRILLEGRDATGDEVRTTLDWTPLISEWIQSDYQRKHGLLLPFDWSEDDE